MRLHPAAQIMAWCLLVIYLQVLTASKLQIASALIMLGVIYIARHKFIMMVHGIKWIMLSLLLIYAFSTPGAALFSQVGVFSPTVEGLIDGAIQLMRLLAALAALAVLLERLHRQHLIAGLYTLLSPLQLIGVSRECLAVRLALTLHYAEITMLRGAKNWQSALNDMFEPHAEPVRRLELSLFRFGIGDAALILSTMTLIWLVH